MMRGNKVSLESLKCTLLRCARDMLWPVSHLSQPFVLRGLHLAVAPIREIIIARS